MGDTDGSGRAETDAVVEELVDKFSAAMQGGPETSPPIETPQATGHVPTDAHDFHVSQGGPSPAQYARPREPEPDPEPIDPDPSASVVEKFLTWFFHHLGATVLVALLAFLALAAAGVILVNRPGDPAAQQGAVQQGDGQPAAGGAGQLPGAGQPSAALPAGPASGAIPAGCLVPDDQLEVRLEDPRWTERAEDVVGSYSITLRNLTDKQICVFQHVASQNSRNAPREDQPANAWGTECAWFAEAGEAKGQDAHPLRSAQFWQGEYATDCYLEYPVRMLPVFYRPECVDTVRSLVEPVAPAERGPILDPYSTELPILESAQGFTCK